MLIEGFYKNGIEDSTWTIRDSTNTILTKKTFIKGETTKIQQFKAGTQIASDSVSTRADTIAWKYVHLLVLMGFIIFMIVLIVKNYRTTYPETLQIKLVWKCVLCLTLPILVWLAQMCISIFIPDHFSEPLAVVFNFVFIYMYTLPLFIIIVSFLKFRKQIDVLWYVLLFALLYNFVLEGIMLMELSAGV